LKRCCGVGGVLPRICGMWYRTARPAGSVVGVRGSVLLLV